MPLSKVVALLFMATAASADPLARMQGEWRGAGWAKQTLEGPEETIRCRLSNTYDPTQDSLQIEGQCVVPGRRLSVSGMLRGTEGAERITGRWSNPDGIGSVAILGVRRDNIVAFNFSAIDPATGGRVAQNVEWRVADGTLRLRSSDRQNPDVIMSDIAFTP